MKLLVACPHHLFLVDAVTREVGVVEADRPGYYGISWTPDGEEVALGHSGLQHDFGKSIEEYMDSERGHLTLGGRRGVECLAAPHQLLCTDDHILIANTGRNCLTVVRRDDLFYRHVWIDDSRWDRKGPERLLGKHINSVHLAGDRLLLLGHNFNRGSVIGELTWPGLDLIRWAPTKAYQAHNLWALPGGELLTCNTMQGSVIDALTGNVLWRAGGPDMMTRGLACAGKYVFVGMSQRAERKGRVVTDGGVWVLDRDTWREIDFLPMPAAGNVHEVRVVDEPDECHHGQPLKVVPSVQDEATAAYRVAARERTAPRPAAPAAAVVAGWMVHLGEVRPADDGVAIAGDGALALAMREGMEAEDVAITARIDAEPQAQPAHVGLVARYVGPGDTNMIVAMFEVAGKEAVASLWRNTDGEWQKFAHAPCPLPRGQVRFVVRGPVLKLWLNDKLLVKAESHGLLEAGGVGVRGLTGRVSGLRAQVFESLRAGPPNLGAAVDPSRAQRKRRVASAGPGSRSDAA